MVADGVGGGEGGEDASATALENAMQYVTRSMDCYYQSSSDGEAFIDALQDAALKCHEAVRDRAREEAREGDDGHNAHHVDGRVAVVLPAPGGRSRYYLWRDGRLTQLSRDQTIAQDFVDQGIFTRTAAMNSQFAHVLSSALGGQQAAPVVTRLQADWQNVHLICSATTAPVTR